MITRSQSIRIEKELLIDIDFDEASRLWNANKKKMKNCTYQYVCGKNLKNGQFCKRKLANNTEFCNIHNKT